MRTEGTAFLAITMGDPSGIGPEIIVKALARKGPCGRVVPVVIGDAAVMEQAVKIAGGGLEINPISTLEEAAGSPGCLDTLDLKNVDLQRLRHGRVDPMCGKAAVESIEAAVRLALGRKVSAIVTAPIHKEAISMAGCPWAGHTEMLAHLSRTRDVAMMLIHGTFRVAHVSTHASLKKACDLVRKERVLKVIELTFDTLLKLGIETPRIAVAGLNPHAGEGGLFGDEEKKQIIPAVREASEKGIHADGPIPPDTVFTKMKGGLYDAIVAMYHDQGHIPVKLMALSLGPDGSTMEEIGGVNMTMGLPFVRTSVDHGVAFGKAGQGRANPQSMIEAIELALALSA